MLKAFTPRTVEAAARTGSRRSSTGYIDDLDGAGEVDLIADYVEPLPVTVIAELLGIPEADRHQLRPWSRDICLMYELEPARGVGAQGGRRPASSSRRYLRELARASAARAPATT